MKSQPSRRKRGVILTLQGWQRLQRAQRQWEIQENAGNSYTLEELGELSGLSPNTIAKVQHRQVAVDRQTLESYFSTFNLTLSRDDYTNPDSDNLKSDSRVMLKGQVPLNSPFYVERPPIERLCDETILQPGALIRIKAPKQMGKTSLMIRILDSARSQNFKTVTLSLQLADADVFASLNQFLRWFCAVISRSLRLPNRLSEYWDDVFGSNYNCTDYFESYLLAEIDTPLVLVLDDVDVVFNYPKIATDFFGLLRTWYQKAKYADKSSEVWQKMRLVVVHSTEVYIPLNINQSPFNVGLSIELSEFTLLQVQDLATRYQLDWGTQEVERLMKLIGGNPYLVQAALHHISCQDITLEQLLETATTEDGIYTDYLRRQLWNLQQYPNLVKALAQVVMSPTPVKLDPIQTFKLQSMGVVRLLNSQVVPNCELYRQYFSDRLNQLRLNLLQEHRLATIVSINAVDLAAKMEADSEQTQNLLDQDFQLISQLAQQYEGQILKSIGDGLLFYFPSAINAVNCAQEIQLTFTQTTPPTSQPMLTYRIGIHWGDVIFSYSDVTGTGVNIAVCVQAETSPGGVGISQTVYEAVRSYLPLQPIEIGQRQFEGIEELISLYQLTL
ncbi:AAA-like domain-containing protein [Microcoleus sp. FACHB-831]|uniref:AAA-like domain-containing protein n=1 Tax=Microcoleus sp. FACHB-831 TaxID=2692827 RepID=UPI001685EBAB|nr:AAA-like domain-containing protein [Microcoleus sp. FACHB-831]MBD1921898.1 AAA-like domain-containing protein [Microcoleus sp. FACHB-831]